MGSKKKIKADQDIAIIGMACLFPQAKDLGSFWRNILNKNYAVGEPSEAWGADRYFDPDSDADDSL